ncbi:putative Ig domain-containing protein [Rhizobium sp. ZPR3]|uniref:Ig domain-containing protein n=2 Tax=unclassified Rhizobium TaxID=2613769 RepID=A0AAU7SNB0_9HYPH
MTGDEQLGLSRGKSRSRDDSCISQSGQIEIRQRGAMPKAEQVFEITARAVAAGASAYMLLLRVVLLVALFCVGLSLAVPSVAYAACTVFNFPDSHTTPSTSPMASGGSLNVTIGTECNGAGLNPINDPGVVSPQHGSISRYNAAAGTFIYTNNGDGATSDTFTLVDAGASSFTVNIAIASTVPAPVAGPVSATVSYGSSSNSIALNLSGGTASSVAIGTQASHGTATASGTSITYTPNASYAGPDSFTYTATNAGGTSTPATVTITVGTPTITLSPSTLAFGAIATAYSQAVSATGGSSPYTYAITAGSLPSGLSLSSSTGAITGTPTGAGTYNFSITVTDSSTGTGPFTSSNAYSITIAAPTISVSPSSLSAGVVGTAYSETITASGGTSSYSFAVTGGSLPAGLTLSSGGALSGTPTAGGTFSFTVTATDSSTGTGAPFSASRVYSLTIAAPTIAVAPTTLPAATVAAAYSQTVTASGGTSSYSFAVTAGTLPAGLTLSSGGALSGTPTAGGTFNFTITATDSSTGTGPFTGSRAYSLSVSAPTIAVSPSSLPSGTAEAAYSQTITASGGTGSYNYSLTSGFLPAGIALSSSGVLSGTPTAAGTFNFTITATDSSTGTGPFTGSRAYTLTISAPTISITPSTLPAGTAGTAYSQTLAASGGIGGYSYSLTTGNLPPGVALSSGGVLSGIPTTGGTFNFTLTATDSHAFTGSQAYSITIGTPTITIAPATLPAGTAGTAYNQTLTASGGAGGYSYSLTTGSLPPGVALSSGGVLSGTPTAGGTFNFTVKATDSLTFSGSQAYSITIGAPTITITPATLPAGTAGTAYSQTLTASGGTGGYTYSLTTGTLPAGVALSSGGVLSGTPTAGGTFNFTVKATDSLTFSGSQAYSITIGAPTITIAPATLPAGTAGTAYSQTLTASGGTGGYTYSLTAGTLPVGVALSSAGVLSGTPSTGGTFNFTVTAKDSLSFTGSQAYSITIGAPTITIAPTTLPAATVAAAYSQTITAAGGTSPHTFSLSAGALPPGVAFSSAGILSGTPTASGTFNFTVMATDSSGGSGPFTASRAYTLTVGVQPPVAGNVASSVAANSSNNAITLNITGGVAASVAIATGASHGTAIASGTSITYTPASGYSGSDSFTYTATNASGASPPATVSITITPPTLSFSPASGALPAGMVSTAYSQTVTASGGTSPYGYSATGTLPPGLALNHSTGAITGTPTTSGNYSFSVTATDANGATTSAAYTIAIAPPPTTFVFSPAGGALTDAMAGEAYSQQISATGGTGTKIYSLASGSLPNGLVLNISTGQLTGPLATGTQGDYSFTVQVRDGNGATGTASYTLKVRTQSVTVLDMVVNVPAGSTPPDVYLNRGATGGPFTSGVLAFVEPANAGTATIIQGQLAQAGPAAAPVGWYLHYTLNPAYSGQIRVGYKLVSALGTSNTATITYNVSYDAGKVAEDIDNLVHDFVRSRQNMIANTIEVPGLLQRRQMQKATDPITARMMPSEEGMTLGFSTSLAQMRAAGGDADAASAPFNVWIGGAFLAHDDKNKNDSTSKWGSFAMINMGADYLISDHALIGLSFHYDRMTDPTDEDAELTGNGWLAGPYASLEIGKGVFWNGSLRYGGSSNTINTQFWDGNFKTTRWMADTSIEGQWNLDEDTTISPKLRAIYFSEKVDDYTVKNSSGDAIAIDGFNEDQFRVSLGAEIARSFVLESGSKLTPKLGLTGGFSGLDGAGAFGAVTAGLQLQTMNFWMLDTSLLFNIEGDGQKSVGAKVAAAKKF